MDILVLSSGMKTYPPILVPPSVAVPKSNNISGGLALTSNSSVLLLDVVLSRSLSICQLCAKTVLCGPGPSLQGPRLQPSSDGQGGAVAQQQHRWTHLNLNILASRAGLRLYLLPSKL